MFNITKNERYQNLGKKHLDEGFDLIKQYYQQTRFVKHQIDHFNYFVDYALKNIILTNNTYYTQCQTIELTFLNVKVERPVFTQKIIKIKNKLPQKRNQLQSCVNISSDATLLECGELGNYESVPLFPNEARKRNINYDGVITVDIQIKHRLHGKETIHREVPIGKLPIMLYSNKCWMTTELKNEATSEECVNDFGGYFIIKGKERVLVSQLRPAYNRIYVSQEDLLYVAEIRSVNSTNSSILVQLKYNPETHELLFSLPYIKTKNLLPAGVVFKALGIEEDKMYEYCNLVDENVKIVLKNQYESVDTADDALKLIAFNMRTFKEKENKKFTYTRTEHSVLFDELPDENTDLPLLNPIFHSLSASVFENECGGAPKKEKKNEDELLLLYVKEILQNEIFYHVGKLTPHKSALHLGLMIVKVLRVAHGQKPLDDKDNLSNKRLDASSSLLTFLFQMLFKQFVKTILNQINGKKSPDLVSVIKDIKTITNVLNQVFMTGNWNTQKNASYTFTRVGVSQVLCMQNYGAKISHLRRITIPVGTKGKNTNIRKIHASHFSFICPYETPEGETVGIVLNLALSAHVSTHLDGNIIFGHIQTFTSFVCGIKHSTQKTALVILNGKIVGTCTNVRTFKQQFNILRLNPLFRDVGFIHLYYENEIHIETDEGRFIRPLFAIGTRNEFLYKELVKKLNVERLTWNECVEHGVIVFRDVWELEQAVVALTEEDLQKNKCEYLEISPSSTMMAVMASAIPLSNHSQSPRNAYQSSMGKQAIGIPSIAYNVRYDTTLHVMNTVQKPITRNQIVNVLKFNEMSHGAIAIVAIMTFSGFNQEDSIILNKASIDRGLFNSTTYKTIVEEEKKKGKTDSEVICLPDYEHRNRNFDYSELDEHGVVWKKNVWLKRGTVIIGKLIKKLTKNENGARSTEVSDNSVVIKHGEEGFLDSVLITINGEGARVIKIKIRIPRIPEIGDKFASSTAQKGTCGMIFSQEDLPFDKNGIHPDLIINPHAIPSRMTINMLIEMFFNRVGCELGIEMDSTPFAHRNIEDELLYWAKKANVNIISDILMDGRTGEQIKSKIFIAPCFYQRLKHLVSEKIHARVTGPLDTLTHQPVAGRSKNGALRFGEMEKDALLSHGSTRVLKEQLFDKSDAFDVPICSECGRIVNKTTCDMCEGSEVRNVNMPYATKLLLQELTGMGVKSIIK